MTLKALILRFLMSESEYAVWLELNRLTPHARRDYEMPWSDDDAAKWKTLIASPWGQRMQACMRIAEHEANREATTKTGRFPDNALWYAGAAAGKRGAFAWLTEILSAPVSREEPEEPAQESAEDVATLHERYRP
ncbi:MAG: hypothetical protein AAFX93_14105 [Verrucomicrobiota bacterium]